MRTIFRIYIIMLLLNGGLQRGHAQEAAGARQPESDIIEENTKGYFSQVLGFEVHTIFFRDLYETVSDWLGTPYTYSGKSMNGIDCSGFVSMLYNKVFQHPLNGSSSEMFTQSKPIRREELKEGDLVFFKIHKRRISHVGIYLGSNKFAHASTRNGVIVSDLDEPYYKKYFVKGGRVRNTF